MIYDKYTFHLFIFILMTFKCINTKESQVFKIKKVKFKFRE